MSTKTDRIESLRFRLQGSPLFRFSLSSKELFHSDFLEWLCRTYPAELIPIFGRRLSDASNLPSVWTVEREKDHVDLTFTFGDDEDGRVLIVENKVKSTPSNLQLGRICKKFPVKRKCSFLLLSIIKPDFARSMGKPLQIGDGCAWGFMDYRELASDLNAIAPPIKDSYHATLLSDYTEFISILSEIGDTARVDFGGGENFFSYADYMPILEELRIHDLVHKRIFSEMAEFVAKELAREFTVHMGHPLTSPPAEVFVDSGFSRGTGMFSVYYPVLPARLERGPIMLFIQLQNRALKLFAYVSDKVGRSKHVAEALERKSLWFNFDRVPEGSITKQPKKKEGKFNSYYGTHLYRYKLIDNISATKLAEVTVEYVKQIRDNASKIRKVVRS